MTAKKPAGATIRWPVPPYFRPARNAPQERERDAIVRLFDERAIGGKLVQFDANAGVAVVQPPDSWNGQPLGFADIRTIRMTGSLALQPDVVALKAGGEAARQALEKKPFRAVFRDGKSFSGDTLGHVREAFGWFLFLVKEGEVAPSECFIPAQALGSIEFGAPPPGSAAGTAAGVPAEAAEPSGKPAPSRGIATVAALEQALADQQRRPAQRIGDVLVESGTITRMQLQQALTVQAENRGRHLGGILLEMGLISQEQLRAALTDKLGIPKVDVREFKITADVIVLVEPDFAIRHRVLPLYHTNASLVVAVETPWDIEFASPLRFATGLAIVPVIADTEDLKARIVKEYREPRDPFLAFEPDPEFSSAELSDLTFQLAQELPKPAEAQDEAAAESISDSALVKLLNKIVQDAYWQGASDIHFESNLGKSSMRVRFRVDGVLKDYLDLPAANRNAVISRTKIMAGLNIAERRLAQDGKIDFAAQGGGLPIELRVATVPTANGLEDAVLRILSRAEPLPLDKLSLTQRNLAELKRMTGRSHGLILVCGPTGSGKTTTLHALLGHLNRPDVKIWTVEDPIEITQPGLRQVQVNNKIGWNFATVMQAFLRADPDVIMMGEVRAADAAKICIEASLTGHLVFSTLHTNSAQESVTRLLDLGMDPFNLSDALIGILSQRLARRLCDTCKRPYLASEQEIADFADEYCAETRLQPAAVIEEWRREFGDRDGRITLHAPVGCDACIGGYKGRIGVHELLAVTPRIKKLISARAATADIAEAGLATGLATLRQDGIEKVLRGLLSPDSARHSFN